MTDITPEPTHVTKGPKRAPLLITLAVLALAGLGAAIFVVNTDDERDPDDALASAQDAVKDAKSFRLTAKSTDVSVEGDSDNGSETTTRSTSTGEWSDGTWHVTNESDFYSDETVATADGVVYSRYTADPELNGDEPVDDEWDKYEADELGFGDHDQLLEMVETMSLELELPEDEAVSDGWADEMAISLATMLYVAGDDSTAMGSGLASGPFGPGLGGSPTGYLDALKQMSEPKFTDSDTLTATLHAPHDVVEAFGRPIPDGAVELDLGPDDLPTGLRLHVASGRSSSSLDFTFTDWNAAIEIAVPGDDEIDPTPWIEEEQFRSSDVAPVLPSAPPGGWPTNLVDATPLSDWTDGAPDDCDMIEVDYDEAPPPGKEDDDDWYDDAGYVWLYEYTVDCALAVDPTPFAPGGPGGVPSRRAEDDTLQLKIGETVVELDTSLTGADLDAFVKTLALVDMEAFIATVAAEPADWAM